MEWKDVIIAISTGVFLSVLIGPIFFMLMQTSVTKGLRAAVIFNLGACLTDIILVVVSFSFSYRILDTLKSQPFFYLLGGIILLFYGVMLLFKAKGNLVKDIQVETVNSKSYLGMFAKGFLLNLVNFGIFGFWLVVVVLVGPSLDMNYNKIVIFFAIVFVSYMLADVPKIILAKYLLRKLTPYAIIQMKKATGCVIIVFGILLIFQTWFHNDQNIIKNFLHGFGIG